MNYYMFLEVISSCAEEIAMHSWNLFLLYGSACVSWGYRLVCGRSCTVCKQKASVHCEPCVFSDDWPWWLSSHTGCNCEASLHSAEKCVFLGLWLYWRRDCSEYIQLPKSKVCLESAFSMSFLCPTCVALSLRELGFGTTEDSSQNSIQILKKWK